MLVRLVEAQKGDRQLLRGEDYVEHTAKYMYLGFSIVLTGAIIHMCPDEAVAWKTEYRSRDTQTSLFGRPIWAAIVVDMTSYPAVSRLIMSINMAAQIEQFEYHSCCFQSSDWCYLATCGE